MTNSAVKKNDSTLKSYKLFATIYLFMLKDFHLVIFYLNSTTSMIYLPKSLKTVFFLD